MAEVRLWKPTDSLTRHHANTLGDELRVDIRRVLVQRASLFRRVCSEELRPCPACSFHEKC